MRSLNSFYILQNSPNYILHFSKIYMKSKVQHWKLEILVINDVAIFKLRFVILVETLS